MKRILIYTSLLFSIGCGSLDTLYVEADQATFNAVAPIYLEYSAQDTNLDADQRDRRARLVRAWKRRIEEGLK